MNKFKIGDKVHVIGLNNVKGIITRVLEGDMYHVSGTYTKHDNSPGSLNRDYISIELSKTEDKTCFESLMKSNRWEKIIKRTTITNRLLLLFAEYKKNFLTMDPFYQREIVWTKQQKRDYIKAVFENKVVINPTLILNIKNRNKDFLEVLDGKQRLTALFEFLTNELSLENGVKFKDLCREDKLFLLHHDVNYTRIERWDLRSDLTDSEKIELFLEINELGTKMNKKHLEKVKSLKGVE